MRVIFQPIVQDASTKLAGAYLAPYHPNLDSQRNYFDKRKVNNNKCMGIVVNLSWYCMCSFHLVKPIRFVDVPFQQHLPVSSLTALMSVTA